MYAHTHTRARAHTHTHTLLQGYPDANCSSLITDQGFIQSNTAWNCMPVISGQHVLHYYFAVVNIYKRKKALSLQKPDAFSHLEQCTDALN